MVIILEGIDRVGKTTLANAISTKYMSPIFKEDRLDTHEDNFKRAVGHLAEWQWMQENKDIKHVIVDRFHWTEAVYGVCERKDRQAWRDMVRLENVYMVPDKEKYLIIYVMPYNIVQCSEEHGSDLSKHDRLFDRLYMKSGLNTVCITLRTDNKNDFDVNIQNALKFLEGYL